MIFLSLIVENRPIKSGLVYGVPTTANRALAFSPVNQLLARKLADKIPLNPNRRLSHNFYSTKADLVVVETDFEIY